MSDSGLFTIGGVPLSCKHCGHGEFSHRRAQLNTRFLSFLDLDWLNASADVYACTRCGFLHWFLPEAVETPLIDEAALSAERLRLQEAPTAILCLACGATIPADSATCAECGWSYHMPEQRTDA